MQVVKLPTKLLIFHDKNASCKLPMNSTFVYAKTNESYNGSLFSFIVYRNNGKLIIV